MADSSAASVGMPACRLRRDRIKCGETHRSRYDDPQFQSQIGRIRRRFDAQLALGTMKEEFQLVLQFRCNSLAEFDAVVEAESEIESLLGNAAVVDGHDAGSGEANIFIHTCRPEQTFSQLRPWLEERTALLGSFKAAYRSFEGERFTVLWPESSALLKGPC